MKVMAEIKEFITVFLHGKMRVYKVLTDTGEYQIGARSYCMAHSGFAVFYDGFSKVGTFLNAKSVIEV